MCEMYLSFQIYIVLLNFNYQDHIFPIIHLMVAARIPKLCYY